MFGSAESWRKQYGVDTGGCLPSLHEDNLRLHGGTVQLDAARQAGLGGLLVERTGKSLPALWEVVSGGAHLRCPVARVPDQLARAGAGQFGPRELGMLQRYLVPAADGSVGLQEWLAAFAGPASEEPHQIEPASRGPAAGVSSPYIAQEKVPVTLRDLREDGRPTWALATGDGLPSNAPAAPVHESWPGGFREVDLVADEAARAAQAADIEWRQSMRDAPFGVKPDKYAGLPPRGVTAWGAMAASPTYARSTGFGAPHDPPYATRPGTSELDLPAAPAALEPPPPPSEHVRGSTARGAPYGNDDNAVRRAAPGRTQVSTPYASGGAWDRPH